MATLRPLTLDRQNHKHGSTSKSDISNATYLTSKKGVGGDLSNPKQMFLTNHICFKYLASRAWRADFWHIYLSLNQKPLTRQPTDRVVEVYRPLRQVVQYAA